MSTPQTPSETNTSAQGQSNSAQATPLDMEKLVEKVYQLMCAEARLTRARGQVRGPRR